MSAFLADVIRKHGHKAMVRMDGSLLVASVDDGGMWHVETLGASWAKVYEWLGY